MLLFVLSLLASVGAVDVEDAGVLLKRADSLRTANYAEFAALLEQLDKRSAQLSPSERHYLRYLKGWQSAYDGRYQDAIALLERFDEVSSDVQLQFRAGATVVNVFALGRQYEQAFTHLGRLLKLLPQISDPEVRALGLGIAAYLYNQVGQYELGMDYADRVIAENAAGRGECVGGHLKLEGLYRSGKLRTVGGAYQKGIDACVAAGEKTYANVIRTFQARLLMDQLEFDAAIELLKAHHDEVKQARYPLLISEYDALLAHAYWRKGNLALTRSFALSAIDSGVTDQYTEPSVSAYRLLYEVARAQGDLKGALAFHEKFAVADKAYLDDVSARQLAFQRVQHEAIAGTLQIEEFGILLPGCNAEQARQRSEQLREAIAGISTTPGLDSGVSASFGVAGTPVSGYELWQLLGHADAALYQAKRAGRNRVAVFDPNYDLTRTTTDVPAMRAHNFA